MISAMCAAVLMAAALVHVYWALGGRRGRQVAIPQDPAGRRLREPSAAETLAVAAALVLGTLVVLLNARLLPWPVRHAPLRWCTAALAAAFVGRALGPFRYCGLFKRVRHTRFGRFDTWFYCPLCLMVGSGLAVEAFGY